MRTVKMACAAAALAAAPAAFGQTIDPYYACGYRITDLGSAPGVTTNYGGLTFDATDPDVLLLGGSANNANAAIYRVRVLRDADGHVTGFDGTATLHASAPNIDGGLTFGPDGVLFYTTYSNNMLGQIKPGSAAPDRVIGLSALGVASSTGTLQFVPPGFPGAGRLKIASYTAARWYDATVSPDGNGTFDINLSGPSILLQGGPEGIVYVEAGATLFEEPSVLVCEYINGRVASYEVDANGDPVPATRRDFLTGLSGAEGGTRDPITGDFLFSTFGSNNRVLVVKGFTPDCRADLHADCALNVEDFTTFRSYYLSGDMRADFTDDGQLTVADFAAFRNAYLAGCP